MFQLLLLVSSSLLAMSTAKLLQARCVCRAFRTIYKLRIARASLSVFSSTSSLASTRIRSFLIKYFCSQLCCCSCTRRINSNFYLSDPHPELTNIAELRDVQASRNCRRADDLQSNPTSCLEVFRDLRQFEA